MFATRVPVLAWPPCRSAKAGPTLLWLQSGQGQAVAGQWLVGSAADVSPGLVFERLPVGGIQDKGLFIKPARFAASVSFALRPHAKYMYGTFFLEYFLDETALDVRAPTDG